MTDLAKRILGEALPPYNHADPTSQEEAEDDRKYAIEQRVLALIRHAFARAQVPIAEDESWAVRFDVFSHEGEVTVEVDSGGIPLASLMRLTQSGLSDDFRVDSHRHSSCLILRFVVHETLVNGKVEAK